MKRTLGQRRPQAGFSLAEMLVAVIIGAMILTAVLGIYGRANRAADAVLRKIESPSLASEVLQLIAEDLARTLGANDLSVQIRNGFDNGFVRAELVLRRTFHDKDNKEQTLEEITWRAGYDREGRTPGLILYRSYEGIAPEDKLLDDNRANWEKNYPFVPICRGVTFFQVQACKGDELLEQWPASSPPPGGVRVTISFVEPYETVRGTYDVLEQDRTSRTIVIDAARKIKFSLPAAPDANDPNAPGEPNTPREPNEQSSPERTSAGRQTTGQSQTQGATREPGVNERPSRPTRPR